MPTKVHTLMPTDKTPQVILLKSPEGSGATPTDETKNSPTSKHENPLDDSTRIAWGLGGYTRGCARGLLSRS